MDTKKEVNRVMLELKAADVGRVHCKSSLYGALIMIRTTLIKSKEAQVQLVQAGCIPRLLDLLTPPTATGNWLKTVDIVISILANMCLEEEEAREQVIGNKGLSAIVEATKCTEKETIHNRGVRAVANLMQHSTRSEEILKEVFDLEFHIFVARRLMETNEKECKQTYLRAVRLFGQQKSALIKLIDSSRSVQAVASLLKDDDEKLNHKSLRILHEFSALRCCANFVEQILAANILEELVQAAESLDDEISSLSLSIILKLCEYENIRPPLGAAGLISAFMRLLECERSHVNHISILNALCLCCFEAVNRHRLYQEKTLEFFMSILNSTEEQLNGGGGDGKFTVLRDRIISCLVCFLYNDECFDKLLELDLVKAVIDHLKRVCNLDLSDDDWSAEVQTILKEGKSEEVKETIENENESEADVMFDHENEETCDNVNNPASPSKNVNDKTIEEGASTNANDNDNTSDEMLIQPDQLDQEIMDISMNDTEIITPSGTQESRHVFSIDSPTYQMEQHSWRLEDHTSGVTCKNYSEEFRQEDANVTNPKPFAEGSVGKFSPYSPLSVGSSYYSPAHPSPVHSLGSSPRHSNFQTGSLSLGSQSPRSSPAWSPTISLHSDDTWSSSDPAGRSPSNLIHSPNSHQGQFSPLINPYPASPPPVFLIEDRNDSESPLHASQVSNASNRTTDSQEDIFLEYPKPMFSIVRQQSTETSSSFSGLLTGINQKPVYSASEEEDDEDENTVDDVQNLRDECGRPKGKKARKIGDDSMRTDDQSSEKINASDIRKSNSNSKIQNRVLEASNECLKPTDMEINTDDNATFSPSALPNTGVRFVRLNSEPCLSVSSPNVENIGEKHEQFQKNEGSNVNKDQSFQKVKQLDEDFVPSSQIFSVKGSGKSSDKKLFSKQCSFPGRSPHYFAGDNAASSSQFGGSSSPYRAAPFDLPFNSPSMSPFSRYGSSPYASPNPYHTTCAAQNFPSTSREEGVGERSSRTDKKPHRQLLLSSDNPPSAHSSLECQPSCSSACQEDSRVLSQTQNQNSVSVTSDQQSASKSGENKDSERLNRIKRKTEENVFVLLSRISVKTDPSQHLPKYAILSALTKYIGVAPVPIQRCIRTLYRVFHNPHCFESVLLEQAPALIVKNLIMDQDGKFPSILFKDGQVEGGGNNPQTSRKINFDDVLSCSQSSETPSDFEMQIQFEFGGDAYSNMIQQRSFRSDIFQPNFMLRGKSGSYGMSRDSAHSYPPPTPDDRIRARIRSGINLMKAITSLALSRYGDGEIQRIWSRGTESEKLMCAISLLHMPIGCGPLHRRQIIQKHNSLKLAIPLLFYKEAPVVREGIVTALSLLAHLLGIQKETPRIPRLKSSCSEPTLRSSSSNPFGAEREMNAGKNENLKVFKTVTITKRVGVKGYNLCNLELISDKLNLNLIVEDDRNSTRKVYRACKEILMERSEVFSAMLGGGYAEADKVDIEFSDVNSCGFEYILHFLHGCKSGCTVIDSLSLIDSEVVGCDSDKDRLSNSKDSLSSSHCKEIEMKNEELTSTTSSKEIKCSDYLENDGSVCKDKCFENSVMGSDASLELRVEDSNSLSPVPSVAVLEEAVLSGETASFPPTDELIQTKSSDSPTNKSTTFSVSVPSSENNNGAVVQRTKRIDSILDKCIDVMAVADRFLVHELIQYSASVLSHTCLYTRTVTEIIYLASRYKLTALATDCIVEVLLSHTSRRDIAELFQLLGLELDQDTKRMLIDVLTNMFMEKVSGS